MKGRYHAPILGTSIPFTAFPQRHTHANLLPLGFSSEITTGREAKTRSGLPFFINACCKKEA
jgi:hypothetical protein